ncbi:ester cyclase [Phycobacter azelaicus]|uniref:ester cyclase n=1 Tax=Phycobacter azelaicus TaxID=2668075 RepID=UPI0018660B7E|nr:nuclear transport factor 2 family protein [Phycobacter azelaicus]MBE1296912.1 hypothetical protein [Paracoccaceae bacterium]
MTNTEHLRAWYTEVWEKGNLDKIGEFFANDTIATGIVPEIQVGTGELQELVMAFQAHVGKFKIDLAKVIEQGDWVAALVIVRTTRGDTGAPLEVTGQIMTRFKDGKIVEAYNHFDYVSLLEQMELLPADTIPICLTGQRLTWAS